MKTRKHIVIPDTQVKPGVATTHLLAAGRYIADKRPDVIVMLGDHWDFPSLSTHKDANVGTGYQADVEAGNQALHLFTSQFNKIKGYKPRMEFLFGNHDSYTIGDKTGGRPGRFLLENPKWRGKISEQDLNLKELGWTTRKFLAPIVIDGVMYSHYFYNPNTTRAWGGNVNYKLSKIHHSFTMGHVQGLDTGSVELPAGKRLRGLVAGSFYQHDEQYKGPQANNHWRGILVKHEVHDGDYDLMEVSLDYLLKKWS